MALHAASSDPTNVRPRLNLTEAKGRGGYGGGDVQRSINCAVGEPGLGRRRRPALPPGRVQPANRVLYLSYFNRSNRIADHRLDAHPPAAP